MINVLRSHGGPAVALILLFAAVPLLSMQTGDNYLLVLFGRIVIFAIAATGLNLLLGYCGQVSLGHGLYLGIGVYAVGILSYHGIDNGWAHLAAGLAVGLVVAAVVGAVCLKTYGVAFIMSTLAFAQMGYFLAVSLRQYGGDDGLTLPARSDFGLMDFTGNETAFYLLLVAVFAIVLLAKVIIVHSPFGLILQAIRQNEVRVSALGLPVKRYKLVVYILSALICVVAGILQANLFRYVSPSVMSWIISGELVVMIVLGGMRSIIGPAIGAALLVLVEEGVANVHIEALGDFSRLASERWMLLLGLFIVAASFASKGVVGIADRLFKPRSVVMKLEDKAGRT